MITSDIDRTEALAEALNKQGIVSEASETSPNPLWAALEAFYLCHGSRDAAAWRELSARLTEPSVPQTAYHRKLAHLCRRALTHPNMPDDRREAVTYAWGYFDGLLKADVSALAASEEATHG